MKLRVKHNRKLTIEMTISPEMIERVMAEWEEENPGKQAFSDMGSDEFSRRMMIEIEASARKLP